MAKPDENWQIFVHVYGKIVPVQCGEASQRVKWLGHVGIAQWDEDSSQGWKRLGIPLEMKNESGMVLDMGAAIRDVLQNGDHVNVTTSLDPAETG
mmetsp:Transcript_2923/g.4432  ORF Transcript_2923/g.4432 Transcript_2923/m.4432 type:complete len:95 (-) Transcript_2923:125-409(-)|eukprot:CAMPEP_0185027316 /NCGR_PEP_ID=MMETSP1103-20130426/12212_1 /TAXON_ID=36769 /ORGANISM="Paraphysomonas bandaiensis, Strain Caron Lab Isolate" /LENGTH=94 /DNA_ID=CAMNT_0027561249 /DNA_START=54 /DNA_END=341 /DNA_ORIENTATION=-